MASFYPRPDKNSFWLRVKDPVTRKWRSVDSRVRLDAPDALRKIQMKVMQMQMEELKAQPAKLPAGVHDSRSQEGGWGWVPAFLRRHYQNAKSLERAVNCWAAVAVFLGHRGIAHPGQVTHQHGHDYVAWRQSPGMPGMKARTKNTALTEMKILSIVMKEAVLRGLAPANPLYQLGIQRTPVKRKPAITSEEQARVEAELSKEWVPQWMRDQWLVAMKHGCRLREVQVPLTPDRLNLERMAITFQGKKGKLHTMPLHEDCVGLVKRRLAEHARVLVELAPSPSKWWRKLLDRAGCPHFSFHSTRVSVITRLALAGIPEPVTRAFVGHASQTVHQIYQQFRVEEVRQVGRVL